MDGGRWSEWGTCMRKWFEKKKKKKKSFFSCKPSRVQVLREKGARRRGLDHCASMKLQKCHTVCGSPVAPTAVKEQLLMNAKYPSESSNRQCIQST